MDWIGVEEVMGELGICRSKAYSIIKQLNWELEGKGYLTIRGKVPRKYFRERFCLK